jgi:conjugal transfer pilus assembly protein TraK
MRTPVDTLALGLAAWLAAGAALADGMAEGDAALVAAEGGGASGGAAEDAARPAALTVDRGPNDVWVAPGEEVAIRVAIGHINRVETPFAQFDIWTESPEEFEQRGHVFYVSPQSDRPISMFITPRGDERLAFSLILTPEAVRPAQVRLRLGSAGEDAPIPIAYGGATGAPSAVVAAPALSSPSFESGPYEESLTALVKDFVVGMVPQSYSAAPQTGAHPRCRNVGGVATRFAGGQRFIGPAFEVFVGVARNDAVVVKAYDETWCAGPDVAAVALWPSAELGPGQSAEVIVVRRRAPATERPARMRASLVQR